MVYVIESKYEKITNRNGQEKERKYFFIQHEANFVLSHISLDLKNENFSKKIFQPTRFSIDYE